MKNNFDKKKYIVRVAAALVIIALVLAADLVTKAVVAQESQNWDGYELTVIEGFFSLRYITNTGAAFSMAAGCDSFYSIIIPITFVVLAAMLGAILWPADRNLLFYIGLALMFSGALGNLVDRIWLNYVRDFLSFTFFGWHFAVFNVADAALCVGVGLFIVWIIFFYAADEIKKEKEEKAES